MPSLALLAGGYGTRLYPITQTTPKAMLKLGGEPFIGHQLALLKRNGINKVVICTGYLSEQIKDFVGDGKGFDLTVDYSIDGANLLGTGGAIQKALPLLGEEFFIMYGDSYLPVDFRAVYNYYLSQNKKGLMCVLRNNNKWDTSNIVFENRKILNYDKTQKSRNMDFIDYGLSIISKSAFAYMVYPKTFDLSILYNTLITREQMAGYEVQDRFYEIGSLLGLAETEEYLLRLSRDNRKECI